MKERKHRMIDLRAPTVDPRRYSTWTLLRRFWLGDHAFVRAIFPNFYWVDDRLSRSNHPTERRLKAVQKRGVRSVLSLRDPNFMPSRLEQAACERLGLELRFVPMRTNALPSRETVEGLLRALREMPKPMLVHCKSGADRTGLAVTLYRHVLREEPLAEARRSLHWFYGHLSFGNAGIVHGMLDAYAADHARTGIKFEDWLKEAYDRRAVGSAHGSPRHSVRDAHGPP
jgi:protein tyrosine phosphatase (PTP) superfamily phosphohydrolase (DUF442 family)